MFHKSSSFRLLVFHSAFRDIPTYNGHLRSRKSQTDVQRRKMLLLGMSWTHRSLQSECSPQLLAKIRSWINKYTVAEGKKARASGGPASHDNP